MSLKKIVLKKWYDSDVDNILDSFYIPALQNSIAYKRLTGFFSSSTLALCAKGITELINNKGKISIVTSPRFQQEDIEAIKEVYENVESVTEKILNIELDNIPTDFIRDHVRAFGWLLKNKKLEIKIAILKDENGMPLEEKEIRRRGLFHQKVGILEDKEGNKVSFSGSENETANGWLNNVEEFKVFRSWESSELSYLISDEIKFEKYWKNESQKMVILDLPTAIEKRLIEKAPNNIEDLNLEKWYKYEEKKKIFLRDYQKEAIESWIQNKCCGIFEMATGTGKTFTALGCVEKILDLENKLIVIISSPYNHLVTQWESEINNYGLEVPSTIADSTNYKWDENLANQLLDFEIGIMDNLIIITTHDTLSSPKFVNLIQSTEIPIFLIVDEVHGIGSQKRRNGLLNKYDRRLGLSATPKRYFDEEGTQVIFDYFGGPVYEYTLSKAIGPFLTNYEYYPYFVNLTDEELEEYRQQTERIVKLYYSSKDEKEKQDLYSLLCILRQNIVKNASEKYVVFENFIKENPEIRHCLVYCSPQQLELVQNILLDYDIKQHKFTEDEGIRRSKKFGDISERDYLLQNFTDGTLQILVAMKCLDEGVNVPPAQIAIMMSNSGNPKEFVQRRGRVLRKYPGKLLAKIYDIIVTPTKVQYDEYADIEKKIFLKEITRYREFSQIAKNSIHCTAIIERLESEFKIYE
ncbi:MAG: DEAD/DEAH box helicase family protein [Promethearchaeota archaeon]